MGITAKCDRHSTTRATTGTGYVLTPDLRRIVIIGHQFVNADWNRFKPTNAVNRNQYGLTQYPNASDTNTNAPAIIRR